MMQAFTKTTSPLKGEASQWWALSDLNGRPFGCKPNALTAELSALPIPDTKSSYRKRPKASTRARIWANGGGFGFRRLSPFAVSAEQGETCCAATAKKNAAILVPSLHFIGAASKLTLLHLRKGNALRCFSYGIL